MSKLLYEKASSSDKKIKLYKDAYHSLLEGEPDEVILEVFDDIISWLDGAASNGFGYRHIVVLSCMIWWGKKGTAIAMKKTLEIILWALQRQETVEVMY